MMDRNRADMFRPEGEQAVEAAPVFLKLMQGNRVNTTKIDINKKLLSENIRKKMAALLLLFIFCSCDGGYGLISNAMKSYSSYIGESGTALGPVDIDGDSQSDGSAIDADNDGSADGLDTDGDGIIDTAWSNDFAIMSDQEALFGDREALALGFCAGDSAESVTANLTLLTSGQNGSVISWTTYASAEIDDGGAVTRPFGDNTKVTLTATLTVNDLTVTKTFVVTVISYSNPVLPAVSGGDRVIDVSWQSVEGADSYSIYYSTAGYSSEATLFSDQLTGNEATITGLKRNTTYYIWIKANSGTTSSDFSPCAIAYCTVAVVSSVCGGYYNTAAVTESGALYTWGIDLDFDSYLKSPYEYTAMEDDVAAVSCSMYGYMAVTTEGNLYGWGMTFLGDGTTDTSTTPVKITAFDGNVASVACGSMFTMAATTDGNLYSWGYNYSGQLGYATTDYYGLTPQRITAFDGNVVSVYCGSSYAMALTTDGNLYAWGSNSRGQLGDGTTTDCTTPKQITAFDGNVASVSCGGRFTMVVTTDGNLYGWGDNSSGQLGDGTATDCTSPELITAFDGNVSAVSCGGDHTMALTTDGKIYVWGDNEFGQLGIGSTDNSTVPVNLSDFDNQVYMLSAGYDYTMIITSDYTLYGCGYNEYGQLGIGNLTDQTTFVEIDFGE